MDPFALPGLSFSGYVKADSINHGAPIPLFKPDTPPGQISINSLDGWNAAADRQNRRSFRAALGRDPVNDAELKNWIKANT